MLIDGLECLMVYLVVLWLFFAILLGGPAAFILFSTRRLATKPWESKVDMNYMPSVSILVPTYNESKGIILKLKNLNKVDYPLELMQVIVVDSKSTDNTVNLVYDFASHHSFFKIQVLTENARRGKSAALNFALESCTGEIVIVSDADCFWPPDILKRALPFMADSRVGAISGPKFLLNHNQSRSTKSETLYLKSMNLMKLGESKAGFTAFFEGGFSAYKRVFLSSFDPYQTGSDDCGTVIGLAEKDKRALMVPEAAFFTGFPLAWREKIGMKIRRASQLTRVFLKYASLLAQNRVRSGRRVLLSNVFLYVICPVLFAFLLATTLLLLISVPYLLMSLLILLIPQIGAYVAEVLQDFTVLLVGIVYVIVGKKFESWKQPNDRTLISEGALRTHGLI